MQQTKESKIIYSPPADKSKTIHARPVMSPKSINTDEPTFSPNRGRQEEMVVLSKYRQIKTMSAEQL